MFGLFIYFYVLKCRSVVIFEGEEVGWGWGGVGWGAGGTEELQ